jgi:hypothetical protein
MQLKDAMKTTTRIITTAMALTLLALCGCSQNSMTRAFGGNMEYKLPEGTQLITMTWKDTSLWVLYYEPKTKKCFFAESSGVGVMEGTVTIPNCSPAALPPTSEAVAK